MQPVRVVLPPSLDLQLERSLGRNLGGAAVRVRLPAVWGLDSVEKRQRSRRRGDGTGFTLIPLGAAVAERYTAHLSIEE